MDFLTYAIIGGLIPDIIRIIKNRYGALPDYLKNLNFYIGLVLMVGLGVFAVYLKQPADKIEAIAIAFSAPQVVSSLLGNKLKTPNHDANEQVSFMELKENKVSGGVVSFLRNWW